MVSACWAVESCRESNRKTGTSESGTLRISAHHVARILNVEVRDGDDETSRCVLVLVSWPGRTLVLHRLPPSPIGACYD